MKYLTLKISSARGPIYEKDFKASDVFGAFVRTLVSDLLKTGFVHENEHYTATVTPGFDGTPPTQSSFLELEDSSSDSVVKSRRWLTLIFPDGGNPNQAIASFRVDLRIERSSPTIYRKDFSIAEIDSFSKRIISNLVSTGLARDGQDLKAKLYARSGDSPNFHEEIVHRGLSDDMAELEIKIEEVTSQEEFPQKKIPDCTCGHSHEENLNTLLVIFRQEALQRLTAYVRREGSRNREMGGILVGGVFRVPHRQQLFVEIEDYIAAPQAEADAVSLHFTHQTWQVLRAQKCEKFPESKLIVGWYHTHPPLAAKVGAESIMTVRYFSSDDESVHRRNFGKPWQVAFVMDAESSDQALFCWEGNSIVVGSYHVAK